MVCFVDGEIHSIQYPAALGHGGCLLYERRDQYFYLVKNISQVNAAMRPVHFLKLLHNQNPEGQQERIYFQPDNN